MFQIKFKDLHISNYFKENYVSRFWKIILKYCKTFSIKEDLRLTEFDQNSYCGVLCSTHEK